MIKQEYNDSLRTEQIAFFLDAVSFIHRFNPAYQVQEPWGTSGENKQKDWPVDAEQRVLVAGLVGEWFCVRNTTE